MIISVGYRVKSVIATRFRQWATARLREYIVKGFTMDDCPEIYGDKIEKVVGWKGGSDVSSLARKPIQMRVYLKDADLYSFRFKP